MQINTYAVYDGVAERELDGAAVIVIDVLRATSTIITAIENGCRAVIPVSEVEEAVGRYREMNDPGKVLLGGERNMLRIDGFHLSNSPLDYTREAVFDKTVIMTTTNGTAAIRKAYYADIVLIGALRNASAAASAAANAGCGSITLLCAGTRGRYSTDDIIAAGAIINRLAEIVPDIRYDDLSYEAANIYRQCRNNIAGRLEPTLHYSALKNAGFTDDLRFCLDTDRTDVVPYYHNAVITRYK